MKVALDTNLLVRLLTNDDTAQAARVETWLVANATAQSPANVDHVVLCELGWVLQRSYAYSRTHESDLDLIVDPLPGATLLDLGGLQTELEELLGVRVDLLTPRDLPPKFRAEVWAQARPV